MVILVSACLLGENCKYSGGNNYNEKVLQMTEGHTVIPVCPEVLGGLSVPRPPAEIVDGIVRTRDGCSVDEAFHRGAEAALRIAKEAGAETAVLKSASPSCGSKMIYDGSFSGRKIPGEGVFAALCKRSGIKVIDSDTL